MVRTVRLVSDRALKRRKLTTRWLVVLSTLSPLNAPVPSAHRIAYVLDDPFEIQGRLLDLQIPGRHQFKADDGAFDDEISGWWTDTKAPSGAGREQEDDQGPVAHLGEGLVRQCVVEPHPRHLQ